LPAPKSFKTEYDKWFANYGYTHKYCLCLSGHI